MENSKIQAVYWDIGGVLVRTEDRQPRSSLAAQLGISYQELDELLWGGERGKKAQVGLISEEEQWRHVCQVCGWSVDKASELKRAFFAGDRVDTVLAEYVRGLKTRYLTGVISNAISGAQKFLEEQARIADAFDHITFSYQVGVMKPDARIYQHALQGLNVQPQEAVFIDDFAHNVAGAREVGMHAIQFLNREQAIEELEGILSEAQSIK
jgi:epoxide hydrolase-like predicted phosphatase